MSPPRSTAASRESWLPGWTIRAGGFLIMIWLVPALVAADSAGQEGYTVLYGLTRGGADEYCAGPVSAFRMTPEGLVSVIHIFVGAEGFSPHAPLIQARDGHLYGTMSEGGPYGTTSDGGLCSLCGTIFQLSLGGAFQTLHAFQEGSDVGYSSFGSLVQGADLNFYGTTADGGPAGTGTVFRATADGLFEVIYSFPGSAEGTSPLRLISGADGTFYGTATGGGRFNDGTVFGLMPDGTTTTLHTFHRTVDGARPSALTQAEDGTLYGLTADGGPDGAGTFFRITPDGEFTRSERTPFRDNCPTSGVESALQWSPKVTSELVRGIGRPTLQFSEERSLT
jgi:uncharacterized repeat protein (TIGR03803 family)